ncbi:MAG: galactose-1-phosphate uridylyltransferase [Patescibacteria group bacterium]|nr:galactose-1-phosphate uridylyltransferase [Patescibacteria group bacterium]
MAQSELRRNLITKRWVVIATERNRRPSDFHHDRVPTNKLKEDSHSCPFCPGNESLTPKTILEYSGGASWKTRIFPNKFLALAIEGNLNKKRDGIFQTMAGRGAHEVIVATPSHKTVYDLSNEEMTDALWSFKERILDLRKSLDEDGEPKIQYIIVFGNQGEAAGATKEHAHFQLVGLPVVPSASRIEFINCEEYWENENVCLFCELVKQEHREKSRIISENENFLSIADYAGRFPFETWILPKNHLPLFEDGTPEKMRSLAEAFTDIVSRLGKTLNYPPFNIYLRNTPIHERSHDRYYHFYLKIVPHLTEPAGFELGTEFHINPVIPEKAAEYLRESK